MSLSVPGNAIAALLKVARWWTPFCDYNDLQALPASGGFFLPASGSEQIRAGQRVLTVSAVYIFEVDQHAHEFMEAFWEAHKEEPKLQATWKFMKVMGLRPEQVVGSMMKHGLVPVQVRRDWAPAMIQLYREGHHGASGSRHGQALQFAVDHALEDYARLERGGV